MALLKIELWKWKIALGKYFQHWSNDWHCWKHKDLSEYFSSCLTNGWTNANLSLASTFDLDQRHPLMAEAIAICISIYTNGNLPANVLGNPTHQEMFCVFALENCVHLMDFASACKATFVMFQQYNCACYMDAVAPWWLLYRLAEFPPVNWIVAEHFLSLHQSNGLMKICSNSVKQTSGCHQLCWLILFWQKTFLYKVQQWTHNGSVCLSGNSATGQRYITILYSSRRCGGTSPLLVPPCLFGQVVLSNVS